LHRARSGIGGGRIILDHALKLELIAQAALPAEDVVAMIFTDDGSEQFLGALGVRTLRQRSGTRRPA